MLSVWKDIKWLLSYMTSIVMYSIIVLLVIVGVILGAYVVDLKIRDKNVESPLYGAYVIVSGSMEPIIKVRDAVVIRRCNEEDIKVGDVVTYRSLDDSYYGILITHRVVNIEQKDGQNVFITKGDHNETIDRTPVNYSQIQGKVVMRIPKIGYLKYFLIENYGWIIAIVVPSIGIIVYDAIKLYKNMKKKKEGMIAIEK